MKRRNLVEILGGILDELSKADNHMMRPTQIMHDCNLDWRRMNVLLEILRLKGWLKVVPTGYNRVSYQLTQEGFEILKRYREVIQSFQEIDFAPKNKPKAHPEKYLRRLW